ncbi:unnamed protein product [Didymodactylos carnosus]|uniref:Transmembrane protein 120 homolog n=2 Tax=Didymodactylos carnosus TaxID=1234261 RepID=A0A8S2FM92_9BILA|nr:unnamed protein product [Didymodactylos carnosus]CAF4291447.1 unnamed protein product [Didymodactylos carnosus]
MDESQTSLTDSHAKKRRFTIAAPLDHNDITLEKQQQQQSKSSQIDTSTDVLDKDFNTLYDNWIQLDNQLKVFEPQHKEYVQKLDEVEELKMKYRLDFDRYMKKLEQIQKDIKYLIKQQSKQTTTASVGTPQTTSTPVSNDKLSDFKLKLKQSQSTTDLISKSQPSTLKPSLSMDKLFQTQTLKPIERLQLIDEQLNLYHSYLHRIADTLPRKDTYLRIILGAVDVSILNRSNKWKYKEEYEKFKFIITIITMIFSFIIWIAKIKFRAFDAIFHFLLVWYYCTLTIRESILIVNGSNINGWWRAHHFISTVCTGILLTWPESQSYHQFRTQFFIFSFYLSVVQVLQFYYQRGCLYRLRALGETCDMDITIEGFHSWMFRGLSFLVPFLLVGYTFQFYNAYTLWTLSYKQYTNEWQVRVLAIIFFILSCGNTITTLSVLRTKFRKKPIENKQKYLLGNESNYRLSQVSTTDTRKGDRVLRIQQHK